MKELWTPQTGPPPVRGANLPIVLFDPTHDPHVPRGPYNVDSETTVADKILSGSWFIHPWELTLAPPAHHAFVHRIGRECRHRGIQLRPSPQAREQLTLVFGLTLGLDTITVPTPEHLAASIDLLTRHRHTQRPIPHDTDLP